MSSSSPMILIMNYFQTSLQLHPFSQAPNLHVWILAKHTHLETLDHVSKMEWVFPFTTCPSSVPSHLHNGSTIRPLGQANRNQSPPDSLFLTSHIRLPTPGTSTKICGKSVPFPFPLSLPIWRPPSACSCTLAGLPHILPHCFCNLAHRGPPKGSLRNTAMANTFKKTARSLSTKVRFKDLKI